jgi:hypothetical protein
LVVDKGEHMCEQIQRYNTLEKEERRVGKTLEDSGAKIDLSLPLVRTSVVRLLTLEH